MPCGDKWKNKTMRRMPLTYRRGMGAPHGQWVGEMEMPAFPSYRPGCPAVQHPGLQRSYLAMESGIYTPYSIRGALPVCPPEQPCGGHSDCPPAVDHHQPWWEGYCCESCATGHECECGGDCTGACSSPGMGQSSAAPPPPRARREPRRVHPVPFGGGPACNPYLGPNPGDIGCAPTTNPVGLYYGFRRGRNRRQRRVPYPIEQQPYWIGKSAPYYAEPFAGCPTRRMDYWIDAGCDGGGIGKRGLTLRGKKRR